MGQVRKPVVAYDGKKYVQSHGPHKPMRIGLHDPEMGDMGGIREFEVLAKFFQSQGRGYGYHFVVDGQGFLAELVDPEKVAWGAAANNHGTIHISLIGFASWSRETWSSRKAQLEKVARVMAWLSKDYGIPLQRDPLCERGIFTHGMWSNISVASDHTDLGPGFGGPKELNEESDRPVPFYWTMWRARYLAQHGW